MIPGQFDDAEKDQSHGLSLIKPDSNVSFQFVCQIFSLTKMMLQSMVKLKY